MILDAYTIHNHAFKVCPCCGASYTSKTWEQLPPAIGGLRAPNDDFEGDTSYLEYRNCTCGSTIVVVKENLS